MKSFFFPTLLENRARQIHAPNTVSGRYSCTKPNYSNCPRPLYITPTTETTKEFTSRGLREWKEN